MERGKEVQAPPGKGSRIVTYKEARAYLEEVSKNGSVPGLKAIRALLGELGNPQQDLKFIHIAGTNGKGSVLAYTSSVLREAGYRTGSYVSPTVVSYLERIQVDGVWISEEDFAESVDEVQKAAGRMAAEGKAGPTVFEMETAAAFLYFRKQGCGLVVLETGLGGSLDATNVVDHTVAAVFTSISRDHMEFLGETLAEIAGNKAGILKKGCLAVTAAQKPEVMEVLEQRAGEMQCRLYIADDRKVTLKEEGYRGQRISVGAWKDLWIPLAGKHQITNALTALRLVEALKGAGYDISEDEVRKGFAAARWPGRFTCISEEPLIIVDGAHNEEAAMRLKESLMCYFPQKKFIFIMGMFRDKEYGKIAEIMGPLAYRIYTVELPDRKRTLKAVELKDQLTPYCARVEAVDIETAVRRGMAEASGDCVLVAFGSLSYLGKVMELVR